MPLALIIPLMLFLSGCGYVELVDTIDTTDKTTVKPFGVHLGVDKYLNGKRSASDWLAVESDGRIDNSSDYYYTVYASTPKKNTDFPLTQYYVDKLTNTIVGVQFSDRTTGSEDINQLVALAKALSNTLDEKYQDFFRFKGHHEFGVYEIITSKIQNGGKVLYTKKFTSSGAAEKYIDEQNKLLTGSPFAYNGFYLGDIALNPRTTYRYYSKFMNELDRIDDMKVILSDSSHGGVFDIPSSYVIKLTYSLSSEYARANYATKWEKAVRDALSKYNSDINSARVESQHY